MTNNVYIAVNNKKRAEIEAQVKAFEQRGGKIKQIPSNFCDNRKPDDLRSKARRAELTK